MRESVIRRIFPNITESFLNWRSSREIIMNELNCLNDALCHFNHKLKILGILTSIRTINDVGFQRFVTMIEDDPIESLVQLPYIGPVTVYHLAKNIGLDVAKPDRHLVRIAQLAGYPDVHSFCEEISEMTGDRISVVDIVYWRFATINSDYLHNLSIINYS
jgi:hypothetical protein